MAPASVPAEAQDTWQSALSAQAAWAKLPVSHRLQVIRDLRFLLVREASPLAAACARVRGVAPSDVMTTELLPLAESCRFLEREAVSILAPRPLGLAGRPLWLSGVQSEVRRDPRGLILILAPSNYPLFLAGAQALQALVAGNAVLLKPAPGATSPVLSFAQLLAEAGLPSGLVTVLPEDAEPVHDVIRHHADQVILTGGIAAGQAILRTCAEAIVPATVELSGLDSFHVLADADPARAADVLLYGLSLNRGRSCIAPRRIFVHRTVAPAFRQALKDRFRSRRAPSSDLASWVRGELNEALAQGANVIAGAWADAEGMFRYPLVLEDVPADSRLWSEDHFAPIAVLAEVQSEAEALRRDHDCPLALGAAVFGSDVGEANHFAHRLAAPVVTVNDVIVPTGDPRLPFGGRHRSGFGVTRGREGLLDLTLPRVISRRSAKSWLPHLDAPRPDDEERYQHLLNLLHGQGWWSRLRSLGHLASRGNRGKSTNPTTKTSSNPS